MVYDQKKIFDDVSFACSKKATTSYSTSFSSAIRLLNPRFRDAIYAVYGFVRFADEIVDTFHDYDKRVLMARLREETLRAIGDGISLNPILHSFQITYHRFGFEFDLVDHFLRSMEMDLERTKYDRTGFEAYILGSAEVVGLMCLKVFTEGNAKLYGDLMDSARSLGSAFQKVNFLRDLKADHENLGRTYFPNMDFSEFSQVQKVQVEDEIAQDFALAYEGIRRLPKDARLGVFVAYSYYKRLFAKIRSIPSHRIMDERIRIAGQGKLAVVLGCYVRNNLNIL